MKTILLTGSAGFIGFRTAQKLLDKGWRVVGLDNMNDYYDVRLKRHRLSMLKGHKNFIFRQVDIEQDKALAKVFDGYQFKAVINLAARAGVRYSMENPYVYYRTNVMGTLNLLELCRAHKVGKFVLASTSSVYAGCPMPFKEDRPVNTPISPYAASKKSAEVTCYAHHHLYGIDVSVVRYFTVYGPAGRPDMSLFRFIKWIDEGKPVQIFGDGHQRRDFTYVDDIAAGTVAALKPVGYDIFNLGGNRSYPLLGAMHLIEKYLGKKAKVKHLPFHKTDVLATWADVSKARRVLGWKPTVSFPEGVRRTVEWYKANYDFVRKLKV